MEVQPRLQLQPPLPLTDFPSSSLHPYFPPSLTLSIFLMLYLPPSLPLSCTRFALNTCIDPPHNEKVTSLIFQPPPPITKQTKTTRNLSDLKEPPPPPVQLSVSTSKDGKFKSWVLVDSKEKTEEKKREASWACRSVGYYHSLPCRGACFSEDGSLLAVNFERVSSLSAALRFVSNTLCYVMCVCVHFSVSHSLGSVHV